MKMNPFQYVRAVLSSELHYGVTEPTELDGVPRGLSLVECTHDDDYVACPTDLLPEKIVERVQPS